MKNTLVIIGVIATLAVIGVFAYSAGAPSANRGSPVPKEEPGSLNSEEGVVCAEVITPARNPETGDIEEFPTPCDVPDGWEPIQNDIPELDLL